MSIQQNPVPEHQVLDLEPDSYVQTQQVLIAAAHHDLESLREILKTNSANVQDSDTGYTPLHAAIASCVDACDKDNNPTNDDSSIESLEMAEQTLKYLLQNGAIWNDLDVNNETPGCLALRLGFKPLYEIMVDAGVRAELLLNRLDQYESIMDDEDENEDGDVDEERENATKLEPGNESPNNRKFHIDTNDSHSTVEVLNVDEDISTLNANYLSSTLSFTGDRILDSAANGVMMSWESSLMQKSASLIIPRNGLRILNIGFGMGIFDSFVQDEHHPAEHHIVEAHPDVLRKMKETEWDSTEKNYTKHNVTIHPGTWQAVLPKLVEENLQFDAIFFDTFAEDYNSFREFFSEHVIGLLNFDGKWSFFHGLGADRQVCYDVYTKVVEMDLFEAGFEMEWNEVELPELQHNQEPGTNPWQGVRRSYFAVEKYRLPICKFVG